MGENPLTEKTSDQSIIAERLSVDLVSPHSEFLDQSQPRRDPAIDAGSSTGVVWICRKHIHELL